jgi:hypothetical protein
LHSPVLNQLLEFAFGLMIQTFKQPNQMKKIITCLVLFSILINCQESKENITENKFSKNVGQKIPTDVAERWAARFRDSNLGSKTQSNSSISANTLNSLMELLNDFNGIVFHHALDNNGHYHTLLIPFTEGTPLWNVSHVIDSESDMMIDPTLAKQWAENYIAENPNGIWSHFFGSHVFDSILSRTTFERVDLVHGSNDLSQPQVLLYVIYAATSQNGRSEGESIEVYDMSSPCPAYCAP